MANEHPEPVVEVAYDRSQPHRYSYWHAGYGNAPAFGAAFWVAEAGEYRCAPGFVTGDFEHGDWTRIFYQLEGKSTLLFDGGGREINPGDLVLIPTGRGFRYEAPDGMHYLGCSLAGKTTEMVGRNQVEVAVLGLDQEMETLFTRIREVLVTNLPGAAFRALSLLYQLMARWEELQTRQEWPAAVDNAVRFLRGNYATPFNASRTAQAAGISPSHLRRLFDRWIGVPPKRYHTRYRIDQAQGLLREQSLSISEVAHHMGFSDPSHFSRVFKRITGVTPSEYQEANSR